MRKLLLLLFFAFPLCAANHYVTPTGGGTNAGTDWNNPCAGFTGNCASGALVPADTYYLAGGSGSGYHHAVSDTAPLVQISAANVIIKAATMADHGTNVGFGTGATIAVDGGAGQAIITTDGTSGIEVSASGVKIDGNGGFSDISASWGNPGHACLGTQCGIMFDLRTLTSFQNAHAVNTIFIDAGVSNVTVNSTELFSCYSTCGALGVQVVLILAAQAPYQVNNLTISHNYIHDYAGCAIGLKGSNASLTQYNYFYKNFSAAGGAHPIHGCGISYDASVTTTGNDVMRFNAFRDLNGTGIMDILNSSGPGTFPNMQFYGNLIWTTSGNPNGTGGLGNGLMACINANICTNAKVYSNTSVNLQSGTGSGVSFVNAGSGSNVSAYNNLWFQCATAGTSCGTGVTCITDYGWYDSTTTHTSGPHDQIGTLPFVNWTANTVAGFQLTSETNFWNTLGAPFNVDMNGVTRTISRGALQFTGSATPPLPPTGVTATPH